MAVHSQRWVTTETILDVPGGRSRSLREMVDELANDLAHGVYVGLRQTALLPADNDPTEEERSLVRESRRCVATAGMPR